jgi:Alpha amylase, catalytic domain
MAQIEELFAKAKELGLRILFDIVPNHTSDLHEWFIKSANRDPGYEDFYVWKDCQVDANNNVIEYPNNWVNFMTKIFIFYIPLTVILSKLSLRLPCFTLVLGLITQGENSVICISSLPLNQI